MTTVVGTFESSSSSKVYTVSRDAAGLLSCNCPGWLFVKPGAERGCKHTRSLSVGASVLVPPPVAPVIVNANLAEPVLPAVGAPAYRPLQLAEVKPADRSIDDYSAALWAMEQKFDGQRLLASVRSGQVFAWSRAGGGRAVGLSKALPAPIVAALAALPDGDYDGELLGLNGSQRVVLFDVLALDGADLVAAPYDARRAALEAVSIRLQADGPVFVACSMPPSQAMYDAIVEAGGEGVMLKRRAARYVGKRTADVLKVKGCLEAEAVIVGWEAGQLGARSAAVIRLESGVETTVKVLNNDWHRRISAGSIAVGTRIEIEYQQLMPSGKPRHPRAKRVVGEAS